MCVYIYTAVADPQIELRKLLQQTSATDRSCSVFSSFDAVTPQNGTYVSAAFAGVITQIATLRDETPVSFSRLRISKACRSERQSSFAECRRHLEGKTKSQKTKKNVFFSRGKWTFDIGKDHATAWWPPYAKNGSPPRCGHIVIVPTQWSARGQPLTIDAKQSRREAWSPRLGHETRSRDSA